jgi:hypothetical protein
MGYGAVGAAREALVALGGAVHAGEVAVTRDERAHAIADAHAPRRLDERRVDRDPQPRPSSAGGGERTAHDESGHRGERGAHRDREPGNAQDRAQRPG